MYSFPADSSYHRGAEPLCEKSRVTVNCSSSTDETDSIMRPPPYHVEREQRKDRLPQHAAREMVESQCETGYTTGDTGNELDCNQTDYLYRWARTLLPVIQRIRTHWKICGHETQVKSGFPQLLNENLFLLPSFIEWRAVCILGHSGPFPNKWLLFCCVVLFRNMLNINSSVQEKSTSVSMLYK